MTINKLGLKSAKMYVLMLPKCLKIGWIVLIFVGNIKADPDQTQRWLTIP